MTKRKPLRQRIANTLGLQTSTQVESRIQAVEATIERRVAEAYAEGREDGGNDDPATAVFKAGGQGYRLASGGVREPSISWEENLKAAWDLLQSNPLIDRASEIHRDYIIGRGIKPKAVDPPLQKILTDFWATNGMSSYISELTKQWGDYGAQCVPCYVRHSDGRVKLGYIDPGLIERVIAHPENAKEMWAVVISPQQNMDNWVASTKTQVYRIVREAERIVVPEQRFALRHNEGCQYQPHTADNFDECPDCKAQLWDTFPARTIEAHWHNPNDKDSDEMQDTSGKLTTWKQSPLQPWEQVMLHSYGLDEYSGDCFYIRKNHVTNQTIGLSDHLQVADYADQHDAALYALGEREEIANFYLMWLRILGDDDAVQQWQKKIDKWANNREGGGAFVTNESVTDISMDSPVLNQTGSVTTTNAQRELILGGEGIPVPWFASPSGAHLATLTAQGDPTWRTLSHDQGIIQRWFVEMLMFVRDQAMIAGAYVPQPTKDEDGNLVEPDTSITLPMPEMTVKDTAGLATAFMTIITAAQMAESSGYITKGDAIDLVAKMATELDVHPNVDELKEAAANEMPGTMLGVTALDAVENERSWFKVRAALEMDE